MVGRSVTVGHSAILEGCVLEDGCLVGMGATVLQGVTVGEYQELRRLHMTTSRLRLPQDERAA